MRKISDSQKTVRSIKISSILLLMFSVFFLVEDQKWLKSDLPDDNFTSIIMSTTMMMMCDTGDNCEDEIRIINENISSASGLAFISTNNKTFILTANHFCKPEDHGMTGYMSEYDIVDTKIYISDVSGGLWQGKIRHTNSTYDLCLLSSDMPGVHDIDVAKSMPELGEKVYAISAPSGFEMKEVGLHIEGIFSGCGYSGNCFYTIPSTFGSSGSVILNRQGEIIGMIQMSPRSFDFTSIGVGVRSIRNFLNSASNDRVSFLN